MLLIARHAGPASDLLESPTAAYAYPFKAFSYRFHTADSGARGIASIAGRFRIPLSQRLAIHVDSRCTKTIETSRKELNLQFETIACIGVAQANPFSSDAMPYGGSQCNEPA